MALEAHYIHRCCDNCRVFPGRAGLLISVPQPGQVAMFEPLERPIQVVGSGCDPAFA